MGWTSGISEMSEISLTDAHGMSTLLLISHWLLWKEIGTSIKHLFISLILAKSLHKGTDQTAYNNSWSMSFFLWGDINRFCHSFIPVITADTIQHLCDASDLGLQELYCLRDSDTVKRLILKPDLLYILKRNISLESRAYNVVLVEMIIICP